MIEHEAEHQRHEHHHLLLRRVTRRLRGHLLHDELAGDHHQGQNLDFPRLGLRKVRHPKPGRAAHFHRHREHLVESEEERHLQHHRQAATHGVDAVLLIERHDLFVLLALLGIWMWPFLRPAPIHSRNSLFVPWIATGAQFRPDSGRTRPAFWRRIRNHSLQSESRGKPWRLATVRRIRSGEALLTMMRVWSPSARRCVEATTRCRTGRLRPGIVSVPRYTAGRSPNWTIYGFRSRPPTRIGSSASPAAQRAATSTSVPNTESRCPSEGLTFSALSPMKQSAVSRIRVAVSLSVFSNSA